jgi:hypothetical protein
VTPTEPTQPEPEPDEPATLDTEGMGPADTEGGEAD